MITKTLQPLKDFNESFETIKKPIDFCSEEIHRNPFSSIEGIPDQSGEKIPPFIAFSEKFSTLPKCSRTESGTLFLSGLNAKSEDEFERLMRNFQGTKTIDDF